MSSSNSNSRRKPRSNASNVDPYYLVSFSNIRGLRCNFPEVESHLQETNPDLMFFSESGLNPSLSTEEFNIPGFSAMTTKHDPQNRHGHGLCAYIKDGFPCGRDISQEDPDLPYMCFRVALVHSTSFIFALYRPQSDGVTVLERIGDKIDGILSEFPSANIHICGDFNVHNEEWLVHSNKTDAEGRFCHDFATAYDLTQIVDSPTRVPDAEGHFANLLDLFLTSSPELCTASVQSPLGTSDHSVVSVKVKSKCKDSSDIPFHRSVFRYAKADWDNFRSFISDIPLRDVFRKSASKIAKEISEWLTLGIAYFIPSKKYQQRPNSQPWFTPECAAAIAHRNHFFHSYHQNRCSDTKAAFRTARNHCKRILRNAKDSYAQSVKSRVAEQRLGSREFWRITNKVMNRGKGSVPTIINGPEVISSSLDKAKLFAMNFATNSTLDDHGHPLPVFPSRTESRLSNFHVSVGEVARCIKNLDTNKATGPDNIPVIVLKHLSPELSPILAKLFNRCLKEKCFPSLWKFSSVCPVFKNAGLRSSPSQYRPISLLSVVSKLFEAVINQRLIKHLSDNELLSDVQYGFRSARSTADVLTVISHRISQALDNGFESRAIALDISKAFDKVWHKGLLLKLASYGISGTVLSTIKSFLSNRSLNVVINGQKSQAHSINAGVPQGSLLGPILFLIFINDLPDHIIKSFVDIFADDTTLYGSTSNKITDRDLADSLSSDLDSIVQWGNNWLVTFNASKTKLVSFHHHRSDPSLSPIHMNGTPLTEAPCFDKLLGLKFTPDLRWNCYIRSVAKSAGKMVGSFYRSRKYLTPDAILYLFKSQIRPTMEYCCHIWGGAAQSSLSCLDRVQNRLRNLVGDDLFSSLQPLSQRRDVASLSLLYRYFHGKCSNELHSLVPPRQTFRARTRLATSVESNHPHPLRIPNLRRKFHDVTFFPRTTHLWNSLPFECFPDGYDLQSFKSKVNKHLSNH